MNARQKVKKYKRLYEEFLNHPIKFTTEQYKIDILRFEELYPEEFIAESHSNYVREIITKDIAQSLASSLDKYIDYKTEFCPDTNKYRFSGEIKVINRL